MIKLFPFSIILLHIVLSGVPVCSLTAQLSDSSLDLEIGETKDLNISLSSSLNETAFLQFTYQFGEDIRYTDDGELIVPLPNLSLSDGSRGTVVNVTGKNAGHVTLGLNSSSSQFSNIKDVFTRISVVHSSILITINAVIGWFYFVAWSVSFYPQVYINWKRKSVIGLNFDFLLYNITGFLAYGFFNVGMFWVSSVKDEYTQQHPRGINPVQLNDVIFTIHAVLVTLVTIFQCFIYNRGNQKLSKICLLLVIGAWLFAGCALVVTLVHKITWLTYLYYFSYIKLGVTLIKYIPQAWMNYRRKSTLGWSIGNVLLDFTGGSLSLLQMFLLAYNSDDWGSIFGDPTKFGLGFFSILFDILFIIQHYCLYRGKDPYEELDSEKEVLVNDACIDRRHGEPRVF